MISILILSAVRGRAPGADTFEVLDGGLGRAWEYQHGPEAELPPLRRATESAGAPEPREDEHR